MNEVTEHSAQALQAVKLLAQYLGNKLPKVGLALAAPATPLARLRHALDESWCCRRRS
jgi:hypothetical protein